MSDNTILNVGTGGDTLRTKDRGAFKTPASIIDLGGGSEDLLTGGQKVAAHSLPVVLASDANVGVSQRTDQLLNSAAALTPQFAAINASTSGDGNVLVAAQGAGKKIRVLYYSGQAAAAVTVKFRDFDGTSTYVDLTGPHALLANQPMPGGSYLPIGHFITQANHALTLNLNGAVQFSGHLVYVVE